MLEKINQQKKVNSNEGLLGREFSLRATSLVSSVTVPKEKKKIKPRCRDGSGTQWCAKTAGCLLPGLAIPCLSNSSGGVCVCVCVCVCIHTYVYTYIHADI